MRLFKVESGRRVRVVSRLIRWVEHGSECKISENTVWEGTTTDRYYYYKQAQRRLLVNHDIEGWTEYGVWQRDTEVELIDEGDHE